MCPHKLINGTFRPDRCRAGGNPSERREAAFFGIINENSQGVFAGLQGWLGPVEGATNGGQKAMRQTSPKLKVLGAGEGYSAETEAVKLPKLEDIGASVTCVCVNVVRKLRIGENEEMKLYCVGKHTNICPLESLVSQSYCFFVLWRVMCVSSSATYAQCVGNLPKQILENNRSPFF